MVGAIVFVVGRGAQTTRHPQALGDVVAAPPLAAMSVLPIGCSTFCPVTSQTAFTSTVTLSLATSTSVVVVSILDFWPAASVSVTDLTFVPAFYLAQPAYAGLTSSAWASPP